MTSSIDTIIILSMSPNNISTEPQEEDAFKTELTGMLSRFGSAPVLFVGSGLSRRYLDLPNWEGLLERLASFTGKEFAYYRSSANNDYAKMASLMADDLHAAMWSEDFEETREKYQDDLLSRDSALKILASDIVSTYEITTDEDLTEELELLKKIEVDAIITTNFDDLLEKVFPDFKTYVGQDELLISEPQGVGEIYKIHGSVEKPNSIVLSREDFEEYSDKYAYLAAKLMTFFAEHPVIFIGYSMGDRNILNILDSLVKCMDPKHITKLQDRLIFIKRGPSTDISSTVISTSGVQIPVINVTVPDFKELFEVLGSLERKFPAHILRRLKERVYELVLNNDPSGKLYVDDIENVTSESVDVVLGVGIKGTIGDQGYVSFNRMDICMDVLTSGASIDAKELLNKTIPPLQGVIPIMKYLSQAGHLKRDGTLTRSGLNERLVARFDSNLKDCMPSESTKKRSLALAKAYPKFDDLASKNDASHTFIAIGSLEPQNIDPEELKEYLLHHADEARDNDNFRSYWAKAVCLYDRLVYLDKPW